MCVTFATSSICLAQLLKGVNLCVCHPLHLYNSDVATILGVFPPDVSSIGSESNWIKCLLKRSDSRNHQLIMNYFMFKVELGPAL